MAFIVFEGLDGSGKTSLMLRLEVELKKRSLNYVITREPGGTLLGDDIRHLILRTEGSAPTPRAELLLYEASRAQHVAYVIKPALNEGKWVLCDRFTASSVAFQGKGRDISVTQVNWLNDFATQSLIPDLTVLLDLSVEKSRARRRIRSMATGEPEDRIESELDGFHEKVRQGFLEQAKASPDKWIVLNADLEIDQLEKELFQVLKKMGFFK